MKKIKYYHLFGNYLFIKSNLKLLYLFKIIIILIIINLYIFAYLLLVIKSEQFYYERRKRIFKHYNDSNLVTIGDKINWLVIHDTNRLKGKCADKIKLHDFSKKN